MRFIEQSAAATLPIGPFTDGSGAILGSLNLILGDALLSKAGGALATMNALPTIYPDKQGYYHLGLDTTDTDTLGALRVSVNKATSLPVWEDFMVTVKNAYDALFASDRLQVDVREYGDVNLDFSTKMKAAVGSQMLVGTIKHIGDLVTVGAGSIGFVSDGVIGSLGHMAAVASGAIGTIPYVGWVNDGVFGSLGFLSDGVLGSLGFVSGGYIGTISHAITSGTISGLIEAARDDIADGIWDEVLTGATHNVATSAGKRLRQAGVDVLLIREDTCQAGGTASTVILDSGASGTNNYYDHMAIIITEGTGVGQIRSIHNYVGSTFTGDVEPDWLTTPDETSTYTIIAIGSVHVHEITADGLAQINAEVDTALSEYDSPTKAEMDTALAALNDITVADIIAGVADGSYDLQEMIRIIFAACSLKSSGGGTTTIKFRDSGDAKDRITATVDADGNRSAVTLDGS